MIYATLKLLHILSIVVWVGGMVFALFFLRPAALMLEPPQRVRLMHAALQRFFSAVLVAVVLVLVSGVWMMGRVAKETVQAGLSFNMPLNWTLMTVLGLVMMAIFGHLRFALFKRLNKALEASDWSAGGVALASIRTWVAINLTIGVAVIGIAVTMA
ncbi:CopD family protein [Hydrogenophaga sp.]|uniref:CopD family protein n=1 Tax=Hydrogenophaga sp. TaxID=1904254 RepID=UPI00272562F9|nr:CopD family protein [Hydrogenophaga sp.]MDO8905742.1 CopD family protein [Hydrogenophaga sp.]